MSRTTGPLRQNVSTSAAELRQFVASLKGKSPAEAMGMVAKSGLFRGIMLSLGVQVVLILLLSLPFMLMGDKKKPAPQPAAPAAVVPARPAKPAENSDKPTVAPKSNETQAPPAVKTDVPKNNELPPDPDDLFKRGG